MTDEERANVANVNRVNVAFSYLSHVRERFGRPAAATEPRTPAAANPAAPPPRTTESRELKTEN